MIFSKVFNPRPSIEKEQVIQLRYEEGPHTHRQSLQVRTVIISMLFLYFTIALYSPLLPLLSPSSLISPDTRTSGETGGGASGGQSPSAPEPPATGRRGQSPPPLPQEE